MAKTTTDIELARNQLVGANFKKLIASKKTSKYRIMKDTGISYNTLCYWQSGRAKPSDASVLLVGSYLGIIGATEEKIIRLNQQLNDLKTEIDRISG